MAVVVVMAAALPATAADPLPPGFTLEVVADDLFQPVAFGFTPDGRLYVAEKRGTVQAFDSIADPSPTEVIDVSNNVHDFWDRGLLGFAVDPEFGDGSDFLYLLYTLDLGNSWNDACPDPPGATAAGCVVNGRLSRFPIGPTGTAGAEQVLLSGNWCAQYPSHTIADLAFDEAGNLLVSAGDGASFNFADHGGDPNPVNACGDPLNGAGSEDNEGGALRSQDLVTGGDPVTYDGSILRINKATGAAAAGNPASQDSRIIAYGLRNPFRITTRPGTSEIWIGDVGWGTWEEIDRIIDPGGSPENFGWPCYEGDNVTSARQPSYDALELSICESLYSAPAGTVTAPYYARQHGTAVSSECPGSGGAISGLAFAAGDRYPDEYEGALFIADHAHGCIRVMYADAATGLPDKGNIDTFIGNAGVVDLQVGPEGDLYYAELCADDQCSFGQIVRVVYADGPTAVIETVPANPTGTVPFQVDFDGTASTDGDNDPLTFAWDLDGDGVFDDSSSPQPSRTYTTVGPVTVALLVTDPSGASDGTTIVVNPVSNQPPTASIAAPEETLTWQVGDTISFSGSATDPDESLAASALTWQIVQNHCDLGGDCHEHVLQTLNGVTTGSFSAPDHDYPSFLTIRLTAIDSGGLSSTDEVDIHPQTIVVTIEASHAGRLVSAGVEGLVDYPAPVDIIAIVGGTLTVGVPSPQTAGSTVYSFESWSDGGAQTHAITVPTDDLTLTATFSTGTGGGGGGGGGAGGAGGGVPSGPQFQDVPIEHPYYFFIAWLAEQRITLGCAVDLFCPDDPVTRGQMASFLVRAFFLPPASSDQFIDIAGSPYEADIEALVARGITKGCDVDRFCPNEPVTREQMASFLVRTFFLPAGPDRFTDDDDSVHESDINALAEAGIALGCEPTKFCPDDPVTRAEMAIFIYRSYFR